MPKRNCPLAADQATRAALILRTAEAADAAALRRVFFSSVHTLARGTYSERQRNAWAPRAYDTAAWCARLQALHIACAVADGEIVGYIGLHGADFIDHLFVDGAHGRRGVGSTLLCHAVAHARARRVAALCADVSRAAEPFFLHHGFVVIERRSVTLRGSRLENARMRKVLPA